MSSIPTHELVCPHCKKQFRGELLRSRNDRHRGFKCPHCRLFVPYERAGQQDLHPLDPARP